MKIIWLSDISTNAILHNKLVETKKKPRSRTVYTEKECSYSRYVVHLPVFQKPLC